MQVWELALPAKPFTLLFQGNYTASWVSLRIRTLLHSHNLHLLARCLAKQVLSGLHFTIRQHPDSQNYMKRDTKLT